MAEYIVPQESDQDFEISVLNEDGTPKDISAPAGILDVSLVVYDAKRNVIDKYSSTSGATGWTLLDNSDFATGLVSFRLTSDKTKLALGKIYYEIRVQHDDSAMADGAADKIITDQYLCTIVKSVTGNLVLPTE